MTKMTMPATTLIALAAAGLLAACGSEAGRSPAVDGAPAAPVPVSTVKAGVDDAGWTDVPGTVEAAKTVSLASRVAATIRSVSVEEGSRVRRGDLLVQLDARDLMARVEAAEAQLAAARARRERIRTLLEKEAATRQEMEGAEADDAAAAAALKVARAQLDYVGIRAPFDGWVVARRMQAGDLAAPGQEIVLVQAAGLMRVAATVSEDQTARLSEGITLDAVLEGGAVVPCTISVLSPAGDSASRRHLVKCDLPEGTPALAGSFSRVRVPVGETEPLASVPAQALIERGGLTGLFVVEEGVARLRWISPGASRGDRVLVRAGLLPGEEVILSPGPLADGAPVAATPAAGKIP